MSKDRKIQNITNNIKELLKPHQELSPHYQPVSNINIYRSLLSEIETKSKEITANLINIV